MPNRVRARSLLRLSHAYLLLQRAVGSDSSHPRFLAEYVQPAPGLRLLDLGCGPGHIVEHLPVDTAYTGIDMSPEYIETARSRYGEMAHFVCGDATSVTDPGSFDVVMAMGLIHHLDDAATEALMTQASRALVPGGRFVSIDPVYLPHQNPVARWLISRDRGDHVREPEGYASLAQQVFGTVRTDVRSDLLRVPYSHAILCCQTVA